MSSPQTKLGIKVITDGIKYTQLLINSFLELISGQALVPTVTVIPSHSKANRQHGDLVTGSTAGATAADVTVHESDRIHDQLSVPEQVDHSTSLESLSKSPNINEYISQSTTLESCTQDNSSTTTRTKPSLVHCPTTHATGSYH